MGSELARAAGADARGAEGTASAFVSEDLNNCRVTGKTEVGHVKKEEANSFTVSEGVMQMKSLIVAQDER